MAPSDLVNFGARKFLYDWYTLKKSNLAFDTFQMSPIQLQYPCSNIWHKTSFRYLDEDDEQPCRRPSLTLRKLIFQFLQYCPIQNISLQPLRHRSYQHHLSPCRITAYPREPCKSSLRRQRSDDHFFLAKHTFPGGS